MKAGDLMLGNYIFHDRTIDDVHIIKVKVGELAMIEIGAKNYEPIKITKEWLLAFGFKKEDGYDSYIYKNKIAYHMKNGAVSIQSKIILKLSTWYPLDKKFFFVHELQNLLFFLTGERLEVVDQSIFSETW